MKELLKRFLKKFHLYYRLKYSVFFRFYEKICKPEVELAHKRELQLYRGILPAARLIFDIGAYDGHKTAAFLEISEKVICCEPDPDSFALLQARFRKQTDKVELLNCAIYNRRTEMVLERNYKGSAFNTLNPAWKNILEKDNGNRWQEVIRFDEKIRVTVETLTLDDLVQRYGIPDLIKIDVEGSELQALEALSQPIRFISFECLLPDFREQLLMILERLMAIDSNYKFNIIHNEEIILPNPISYSQMLDWIDNTRLGSFDALAMLI